MSYDDDYVNAVETNDHVVIRKEPSADSDVVTEVNSGIRMIAANSVSGDRPVILGKSATTAQVVPGAAKERAWLWR